MPPRIGLLVSLPKIRPWNLVKFTLILMSPQPGIDVPFQHDASLVRGRESVERAEVPASPGGLQFLSNLLGWMG